MLATLAVWLAFGPDIPEETFLLISRLGDSPAAGDPSNSIHALARPPIYWLLGWTFSYPAAFLIVGWMAHTLFAWVLFQLVLRTLPAAPRSPGAWSVEPWTLALAVVILVYPVARLSGLPLVGHGTTLIPHDSYLTFSFRTLFWTAAAGAYLMFATGRWTTMLWLAAASCYLHPTAGLLAFCLATIAAAFASGVGRDVKLIRSWLAAALVAAAPPLLSLAGAPTFLSAGASDAEWYSAMIKNEADDFSLLYQLAYLRWTVLGIVAGLIAVAGAYVVAARTWRSRHLYALAAVILLFFLGAAAEHLGAVVVPTPLVKLLLPLTPGYRLLSFAFFPFMVLAARIALHLLDPIWRRAAGPGAARRSSIAMTLVVGSAIVGLVLLGAWTGRARTNLAYASWALRADRVDGLDQYMVAAVAAGAKEEFDTPRLYRLSTAPRTYPHQRNVFAIRRSDLEQPRLPLDSSLSKVDVESFADICAQIRRRTAPGSGLIIPPYLRFFRDALPDHAIFLQIRHDANFMLGSPRAYAFWLPRLQALSGGRGLESLPSPSSDLQLSVVRAGYLGISTERAAALHAAYPAYRYMLVERGHELGFARVAENGAFVLYDLARRNP